MSLGLSHLFATPSETESRQHAARELGTSFASWDDLVKSDKLAARLDLVRQEVDDLQHELETYQASTSQIVGSSLERTAALLDSAQALSFERYELADLLSSLQDGADEPLPDEAHTLRSRMGVLLQELDEATLGREYLLVLEELLRLQEATLVPSAGLDTALDSYKTLLAFAGRLHDALQPDVALRDVARDVVRRTWKQLRAAHEQALVAASARIGWPLKVGSTKISDADRASFEEAFKLLLDLQLRGDALHQDGALHPESGEPRGLYAYHALVEPVKLRWRFHFESSRPTNRLDKPEWAFGNILDLLHSTESTVDNWFGDLLEDNGYAGIDSLSEFISQLLPLPLSLLNARLPLLLPPAHPSLLAQTVHQTLLFDDRMREKGFNAARTLAAKRGSWDGLTGEILRMGDVLNAWVEGERDFAREEFERIVSGEQAWSLVPLDELEADGADGDEDGGRDAGSSSFVDLRPTRAAWSLSKLLSQVTERYSPLPNPAHRLAFLLHVQLPLLSSYAAHLVAAIAPLERTSSTFGRVVPGALAGHAGVTGLAAEGEPKGADAARKAVAIWGAARHMLRELERWSDDVFFIQLCAAISQDPVLRRQAQPALVVQAPSESTDAALFSADIERFRRLAGRAEEALVKLVTGEVEAALKTHLTRRWDTTTDPSADDSELPPALLPALLSLSKHLSLLAALLPPPVLTAVYRRVVDHLSNHITQRAVFAGWSKFTADGGADFAREVAGWVNTSTLALGGVVRRPAAPWRRLEDMGRILALDDRSSEDDGDGDVVKWSAVLDALRRKDEAGFEGLMRDGLSLSVFGNDEALEVVKRRVDCPF